MFFEYGSIFLQIAGQGIPTAKVNEGFQVFGILDLSCLWKVQHKKKDGMMCSRGKSHVWFHTYFISRPYNVAKKECPFT